MKTMRSKKVWITTFLAGAITLFGAGVAAMDYTAASADDAVTAESVGLVMDKGAGVRLGAADGNNGIRFVLTMDKTEYGALMEKVGTNEDDLYSEISFGMLITKASYVTDATDLTVENVFGEKAIYEWKPESADENWKVSEGKSLVVNQTFAYLGMAEDYEEDYVGFASLVNLRDYNLTQEFIGRGYMKYTAKDGTVSYRMANYYEDTRADNVRSMVYVAQKAAEDPEMSDYQETLNSLYINHSAVQAETVNVTVNHHKVDVHGKESVETTVLAEQKIGATATATALDSEEWIYNASKSTAVGVVYANDKTVLDLYYDQNPEAVYDLWYVGGKNAVEKTIALDTAVTGGVRYDKIAVELQLDLVDGTAMPEIKAYVKRASDGAQLSDPVENGNIARDLFYNEETGTYIFMNTLAWPHNTWDVGYVLLSIAGGEYTLGVNVVSVSVVPTEYDFRMNNQTTVRYTLPESVKGAIRYDSAIVTLELVELVGDLKNVTINLWNKAKNDYVAKSSKFVIDSYKTGEANTYAFTLSFPWATGDWTVTDLELVIDGGFVVGVNVKSIEIVSEYDLKFIEDAATYQAQYYKWDTPTVSGKHYNEYIKISFDIPVVYGTLNNIQFVVYNSKTTFSDSTVRTNSGQTVYSVDGNKLTKESGHIALSNFDLKTSKTVEFVVKFPWNNADHNVYAILLALRGQSGFKVAIDNVKIELMPDFVPAA